MDRELTVTLTARDGMSRTFTTVGRSADQLEKELTQVDRAGRQASQGLKTTTESAKRFGDSLDEIGTGIGVVTGAMALLGRNARNNEREIRALEVAYGDSADEIVAFTEAIQDSTNFSNDAAREAALVAATLTREYGITADQAQELVERSADLAAVFGVSLTDATERLSGAIRGEAEAAERLGVAVSDSAVAAYAAANGYGDWNAITDESIKGQIRFQAIMEQTNYAVGTAGEQAEGAAGRGAAFRDWLDDTAEAAGRSLGPVGEFLSVSGDLALALPLAGNAVGRLAAGFGTLATTLGPIGLAAAGLAAAASIGYLIVQHLEQEEVVIDVTAATESLTAALLAMGDAAAHVAPQFVLGSQWRDQVAEIHEAAAEFDRVKEEFLASVLRGDVYPDAGDPVQSGAYAQAVSTVNERIEQYTLDADEAAQVSGMLAQALQYQGEQWDAVSAYVNEAFADFERGRIDVDGLIRRLEQIPEVALNAAGAIDETSQAAADAAASIKELDEAWASHEMTIDAVELAERAQADALAEQTRGREEQIAAIQQQTEAHRAEMEAAQAANAQVEANIDAMDSFAYAAYAARDGLVTLAEQDQLLSIRMDETTTKLGFYRGAVNDMEAAYAELQARQAAGETLSQSDIDFMREYEAEAGDTARTIGDLVIEQGKLAQAQIDNAEAQGELAGTMGDLSGSIDDLIDAIYRLLGIDPGASRLAAGFDELQAKVDALSGGAQATNQQRPPTTGAARIYQGDASGGPGDQDVRITVTADTSQADADLAAVQERAQFVVEGPGREGYTIEMHADAAEAYAVIRDLDGEVYAVVTKDRTIVVNANTAPAVAAIMGLTGYQGDAYINVYARNVGPTYGPGYAGSGYQHGGLIHAQHGALTPHGYAWVGESGPELIHAPGGMVTPHTASVAATRGRGGGGDVYVTGPVTVYADDPGDFYRQMVAVGR